MLFSLLKHYLELYISDTALKVSQTLYCFTTSISHGVKNYFSRLWGTGISDVIFRRIAVTNPPIRLMCPMSVCPHFLFPDSNSKRVCPIEFKLDRDIDHHHS